MITDRITDARLHAGTLGEPLLTTPTFDDDYEPRSVRGPGVQARGAPPVTWGKFASAQRRVKTCDDDEAEFRFSCRSSGSVGMLWAPGRTDVPEYVGRRLMITSAIVVLLVPSVLLIIVALTMRHFDTR